MNTFMVFRLLIVVATVILTGSSTFALETSSIILSEVSLEQFQKKVSKKDVELQKLLKEIWLIAGLSGSFEEGKALRGKVRAGVRVIGGFEKLSKI